MGTYVHKTISYIYREIRNHTENQNKTGFSPDSRHEISVLVEHTLGHLRYRLVECRPSQPPLLTTSSAQIGSQERQL